MFSLSAILLKSIFFTAIKSVLVVSNENIIILDLYFRFQSNSLAHRRICFVYWKESNQKSSPNLLNYFLARQTSFLFANRMIDYNPNHESINLSNKIN